MEEYVAKSVLKKELNIANLHSGIISALQNIIDEISAADVQEVKHAHWIIIEYEYLNCSNCASSYFTGAESREQARKWLEKGYAYSYCPYCGAKMDEEENEK